MSEDIQKIAEGLTIGERNGLHMARHGQPMAFVALQGRIRVSMFRKGLVARAMDAEDEDDPPLFRITPLGQQVRAYLQGNPS